MKTKVSEPLLIMLVVAVFFSALSFMVLPLKPVNFFSDILGKEQPVTPLKATSKSAVSTSIDSTMLEMQLNLSYLKPFFAALKTSKNTKRIGIGFFGDSMIEGDLVTNDFRKFMQAIFGGNGVGFVPITSVTAKFRSSIGHSFNDRWMAYNFAKNRPPKSLQCGPSGFVFSAEKDAMVQYSSSKEYFPFQSVRLFYGNQDSAQLVVKLDTTERTIVLQPDCFVNSIELVENRAVRKVKLTASQSTNLAFYGCSFENGNGVYVDNYSFRGNSGVPLSIITPQIYQGFDTYLNNKLIVLNYGLNVVTHNKGDYKWYETSFRKTIQHIKTAFPEASILLIGIGDKAFRENGEWATEPDIPIFIELQKRLAKEEHIAFWSLYDAMGGYNSMKGWVESKPALANQDYTHPNQRGAQKIASLLFDFLMHGYKAYEESVDTVASKKDTILP